MDLQKYDNNSWVIYSNEKNISGSVTSYSIITDKLVRQFEIETSQLHITLTKSLFKSHMINSYHGIGHTVRVMWNAFFNSIHRQDCKQFDASFCFICFFDSRFREK